MGKFLTCLFFLAILTLISEFSEAHPLGPDIDYQRPPRSIMEQPGWWQDRARDYAERQFQVGDYIPTDIQAYSSGRQVASKIAAQTARNLIDSEQFRKTSVGASAAAVDSRFKGGVKVQSPDKTNHSLEFNLRATQTKASVRYVGYGETTVSYNLFTQALQVEVSKALNNRIRVVADHLDSPEEQTERLSLRWSW